MILKRSSKQWFTSSQIILGMILVQVFISALQLLSRVILVHGSFIFSLIAYCHIVAAICVAPFALYFERCRTRNFTSKVWFWLFVNALMGMTLTQGLFYYGMRDTSATYFVNFLNMVPICTFFTSIIFRSEKLRLHTWAGKAKCGGAILCIGGALATGIYKGKEFYLGHHSHHVQLLKVFQLRFTGTMLACVLAAIQGGIIGGALATTATFNILSWTITIKGPSYPPMFNPLALIFVTFSKAIVLGEPLTVGTLLVQQSIVAAAKISKVIDLPVGAESMATVVTNSSPMNLVVLELGKSDKSRKQEETVL
ncbi:hypothetical protein GYH30_024622 [Glycine max]|uniref:WAT1-related protein n=1 Tax=Glycine max TaxID=3847 RepID=A0A0R0ID96_SOYBN|nr:hypothetical protein GYH30_024622 [Glycine max]